MRISTKLSLGFTLVALLLLVMGFIVLNRLQGIAVPLHKDIPQSIEEISKTSHLNKLADLIRFHDEILTQSARNYAFTRDKKWKQRYKLVEPKLDKTIKEAIKTSAK